MDPSAETRHAPGFPDPVKTDQGTTKSPTTEKNPVFDSPTPVRATSVLVAEGYSTEQIEQIGQSWRPLPSASLDPDEINVSSHPLGPSPDEIEARCAASSAFRHSGWQSFRELTAKALANFAPPARISRFWDCGSSAWVLKSSEGATRYRMASNRCRDRFCLPCHQENTRVVLCNLRQALAGHCVRFLTLTLRSSDATLTECLDRAITSFRKLRSVPRIKQALKGGVYFFEVTRSKVTGQWHPHLHALFVGHYLPHELLKKHWLRITGDSFIVDVRGFKNSDAGIGYVAKYASKGVGCGLRPDDEGFAELAAAFHGRRLFSTFGCLRGIKLSAIPESDEHWEPVAPLWRILAEARAGSAQALEILRCLRRYNVPNPADLEIGHEKEEAPP